MNESLFDIFLLILSGCIGGFISGLLGVGGGIIFVPILDYFLIKKGIETRDLVPSILANSFFAIFVSGIKGSIPAFKSNSIHIRSLIVVGSSAIIGGIITTSLINSGEWYSPAIFKIIFCALLIFTLIKTLIHIQTTSGVLTDKLGLAIGLITGAIAGLSGLGGGIIMVPLFMMLGHMNIKQASTLSLAIIPILVFPNLVFYAISQPVHSLYGSTGHLVWPVVIPIIIGVLFTVKAGVNTANKLSTKIIKIIFAGFVFLTILRILTTV